MLLAVLEYALPLLEAVRAPEHEIEVLILLIDYLILLGCAHQGQVALIDIRELLSFILQPTELACLGLQFSCRVDLRLCTHVGIRTLL